MSSTETILVTGGAGFIGSNFVLSTLARTQTNIVNLDKLTYAGNVDNLASLGDNPRHVFRLGDIRDRALVSDLLREYNVRAIVNFAAESHVDRSIDGPGDFIETNIVGTFELLEAARAHHARLPAGDKERFRFLHVSTDEVYGSLGPEGSFTEQSRFAPNSPYAASKASADHLVRSYFKTYHLPTLTTNCSNNYGPYQFPEKLIPLMVLNALEGKPLPVYGDGKNVRDWLYVGDHCDAIRCVLENGTCGETYNIGGGRELTNLELVHTLCGLLDQLAANARARLAIASYADLITFVPDRPGHDRRYSIDASRISGELGWRPTYTFEDGIRETVQWYLDHRSWCLRIAQKPKGGYGRERLGMATRAP